jgi:hypothetical protein
LSSATSLQNTLQQQQQRMVLQQQLNANSPNAVDVGMGMQQRPQMAGLHQGLSPQQLLQQQQQQQQQQQSIPQGMPASPIWTGHIVWSIKTPHGALTEFACHCGAYPVALRGSSNTAVAVDG